MPFQTTQGAKIKAPLCLASSRDRRFSLKEAGSVNGFVGFQGNGAVVLRDRRGTVKAEIPTVEEKGFSGNDPLAIYKPAGSENVDAAKAMQNFTG